MSTAALPVVFAPEALDQLEALYRYIADAASPLVAKRYTDAIVNYCETLDTFPLRGVRRDDIRPGLRITNYRLPSATPTPSSTIEKLWTRFL